jgi:hypothetical protein
MIGPQETHPLVHDVEDPAAQLQAAPLGVGLHDPQNEVFFLEPGGSLHLEVPRDGAQIGQVHGFQLGDVHLDLPKMGRARPRQVEGNRTGRT